MQFLQLRSGNSGAPFLGANDLDTVLWSAAHAAWYVGPGGGGGAVASVFGRAGAVVAATGDYDSDQVDNLSNVAGASVSDALDTLALSAGAVASVFGRSGVVAAQANDYAASQVNNDSSVLGATVKAALNTLLGAIVSPTVASVFGRVGAVVAAANDYAASQVNNDSSVTGATVKAALNTLLGAIPSVPVASVFGRVGAVVAAASDYAASQVNNDSSVTGATVKAALDALLGAIPSVPVTSVFGRVGNVVAAANDYAASQISNDSSVSGAKVKDALNTLLANSGTPLATGAALTNADVTVATSERYVLPAATLTAAHAVTATPGANSLGYLFEIGTQGFNYTITNGGTAGGTIATVLAGTRFAVWVSSDGTDLVNPTVMPLGAEPIP